MSTPGFQRYQAEFTGHIRDPESRVRPRGVAARGMKVYTEIVFNNMNETLSACFPVCRKVLGVRRWTRLVKAFLAGHRCTTPLFRQIPEEFLRWLQTAPEAAAGLPPFLFSLAHYEWVELAIAVSDASLDTTTINPHGDLLADHPVLAPALALLAYDYPVHRISPRFKPLQASAEKTQLLVYRNRQDVVRFVELNPVSARLIELLRDAPLSGREILHKIAGEIRHPEPAVLLGHGQVLLEDFLHQEILWGTTDCRSDKVRK